jgi:hypothetical protein
MKSELRKILEAYRNYVRESITLEPTSVEFRKINESQTVDAILELFNKQLPQEVRYDVHNPTIKAHHVKPETEGYADYSALPDSWYECTICGTHIRKHKWINEGYREQILQQNRLLADIKSRIEGEIE